MASSHAIFEIGWRSFPWSNTLGPLFFVAIGFLLFRFASTSTAKWMTSRKTFCAATGAFIGSFAVIIFVVLLITVIPEFITLRHTYVSGRSVIVEGPVENFQPAPALGPANESFTVGNTSFSYTPLDVTPCFHDAPLHHGPIRNGLNVRIHYHEDCIQRVDVVQ